MFVTVVKMLLRTAASSARTPWETAGDGPKTWESFRLLVSACPRPAVVSISTMN